MQAQSTAEVCQQKWYYDHKIGTVNLKPGDLVLVKADFFKGKRKIRDMWEEETCKVVHQITTDIPSYEVMDQCRWSCILHQNWLLLIASEVGVPLCIGVHHAWDRCTGPPHGNPLQNSHWKEHVCLAEGMTSWSIDAIRWWTRWLTQLLAELGHGLQDQTGGVMGKYPSVSGGWMSCCLPPWCGVLPPKWSGTLATGRKVAIYPHCTK